MTSNPQTEARAIAWRGEYKQPGTDRWIVRYVDDGEPKGKNWRNVTPLVDATALAAKDAELAKVRAAHQTYVGKLTIAERALAERAGGVTVGEWKRDFEAWIKERPNHVSLYEAYHAGRSALTNPAPTHEDGSGEVTDGELQNYIHRCRELSENGQYSWWSRLADILSSVSHTGGEVTEAMVDVALKAYNEACSVWEFVDRDHMRAALEAALRGDAS